MFPRFSELPADLRRKIWLATLGPMTLTFTLQQEPPKEEPHDTSFLEGFDMTGLPQEEVDWYLRPPTPQVFANFNRYYGHVALPDGTSRMTFTVKLSAAYLACKESRDFLRFVFAEPPRPDGGLPSWFRFDLDTIRVGEIDLPILARHAWFVQTQHLVMVLSFEIDDYCGFEGEVHDMEGKDHKWLRQHLTSLQNLTFELMNVENYPNGRIDWPDPWFRLFEDWYNPWIENPVPVPFWTRVVSYREGVSEDLWLTPDNYLVVYKKVFRKNMEVRAPYMEDLRSYLAHERNPAIWTASDDELRNPAEFLAKNPPLWN